MDAMFTVSCVRWTVGQGLLHNPLGPSLTIFSCSLLPCILGQFLWKASCWSGLMSGVSRKEGRDSTRGEDEKAMGCQWWGGKLPWFSVHKVGKYTGTWRFLKVIFPHWKLRISVLSELNNFSSAGLGLDFSDDSLVFLGWRNWISLFR